MKRREKMTFLEKIYVIEIAKKEMFTKSKLIKNLSIHFLQLLGFKKNIKAGVQIQYPSERREYPERYRGRHRLTLYDDGAVKCTSCFLCATACPAQCIYIEPAEHSDKEVEKFPHRYEIDTLLCIYCGYCVEACPVDAIRMDTGIHPEVYPPDPRTYIEDKEILMKRSLDLKDQSKESLYEMHLEKIKSLES